jgi:hypothetical protein
LRLSNELQSLKIISNNLKEQESHQQEKSNSPGTIQTSINSDLESLLSKKVADTLDASILSKIPEEKGEKSAYNYVKETETRTLIPSSSVPLHLAESVQIYSSETENAISSFFKSFTSGGVDTSFPPPISFSALHGADATSMLIMGGTDGSGSRRVVTLLSALGCRIVSEDPETYDIHADSVGGWPTIVRPLIEVNVNLL